MSTLSQQNNSLRYIGTIIAGLILAGFTFFIAKPKEKTSPPKEQTTSSTSGMPGNHPDVSAEQNSQDQLIQERSQMVELFRTQVSEHPDDVHLHLNLANALYDLGQLTNQNDPFAEALEHYRVFLNEQPEDADARTDLAYSLYRTGKLDQAISELQSVQSAHPEHQNSSFNLALMYKEKDKPDSVLFYMRRTAESDPTSRAGEAARQVLDAYAENH